jgi:SnoaL-like domain
VGVDDHWNSDAWIVVANSTPVNCISVVARIRCISRPKSTTRHRTRLDEWAPEGSVERQVRAYNAHDVDEFVACYAGGVVIEDADGSVLVRGREQIRRAIYHLDAEGLIDWFDSFTDRTAARACFAQPPELRCGPVSANVP